jgi:CRP-like cAMP-binding protein
VSSVLQRTVQNQILARLLDADFDLLAPHLVEVPLPVPRQLERRNRVIEHVYFPDSGFASVVANGQHDRSIEVGMIGREGMTGIPVILGADRSPNETFIQISGDGWRLAAEDLRRATEQSTTLFRSLLLHAHAFLTQVTQTALSNGRMARLLLMAHDRADDDQIKLTHEALAAMLGVRRPSVTIALHFLARQGTIRVHRGVISLIDREGLEQLANGSYGTPEAEARRLCSTERSRAA